MIYPATESIEAYFSSKGINFNVSEEDESSVLTLIMESEHTSFRARFISNCEDSNVAYRIYSLLKFPADRTDDILRVANDANNDFRFVKFCVDTKTNTVDVEFDFLRKVENIGEAAYEMLGRSVNIIDECYPKFMQCIYGGAREGV